MNPLELLARTGFLVKGLIYIVMGVLALQVATRLGGRVTGTRGALMTVLGQPFRTLLLVAAIGLLGYAVWRVGQGLLDSDRLGHEWRWRIRDEVGGGDASHHRQKVVADLVGPHGIRSDQLDGVRTENVVRPRDPEPARHGRGVFKTKVA